MAHIDLSKYFVAKDYRTGRPEYDRETLLKIVLFAFMEHGYCSLRQMEKLCETDIRFLWLLGEMPSPSFMTFDNMINNDLKDTIETVFSDINSYIFAQESVDLNHVYLDGTKLRANAGTYSWVWKKSCIKNRDKVFGQVTALLQEINDVIVLFHSAVFDQRETYSVEYLDYVKSTFLTVVGMKEQDFVHGSGKRKTVFQRLYEKLSDYRKRLKSYGKSIEICGEKRNSYSKTDHGATFFRMKKDHMGNDQLLPGYNLQMATCDEYIAHYDVFPFASDMDCFQPMMQGFAKRYGKFPQYPVADAGYGSFNNYLFCQENAMEKFMKFPMYEKECKDKAYQENPYRAANFPVDETGHLVCPNQKRFHFLKTVPVRNNQYGRTEEVYQCEDCTDCPHRPQCCKGKSNRQLHLNQELTVIHREVLQNLNSIHGALLRMNRSIQAEGVFGAIKWNRGYSRIRRRGLNSVILELGLISCGFNLHKYHLKKQAALLAA